MFSFNNRRKFSNFSIDPAAQLRFLPPFAILLLVSFTIILTIYWQIFAVSGVPGDSVHAQDLAILNTIIAKIVMIASVGMATLGILAAVLWIYYSHRIFGPVVPIRRQIRNLRAGKFDEQIKLRKNDELKEIADDLNQLALELAKKSPPSIEG